MADEIISKIEAKARGLRRYFTGKPCRRGHICERTIPGVCVECRQLYMFQYQKTYLADPRNRAKRKEYDQRSHTKPEYKAWRRSYRAKLREQLAGRSMPDVCDICGEKDRKAMHFDHCHTTGKFRGWLCTRCNVTLGRVKDDPRLLRNLADYLERNQSIQIDWISKTAIERMIING